METCLQNLLIQFFLDIGGCLRDRPLLTLVNCDNILRE